MNNIAAPISIPFACRLCARDDGLLHWDEAFIDFIFRLGVEPMETFSVPASNLNIVVVRGGLYSDEELCIAGMTIRSRENLQRVQLGLAGMRLPPVHDVGLIRIRSYIHYCRSAGPVLLELKDPVITAVAEVITQDFGIHDETRAHGVKIKYVERVIC